MAVEKSALRVTELDFEQIRENLKTYLRSQTEFQDFDFEGSGMAVLLDILAYNTHYMGYYLNMVGNEMFLDSAQIRSSVLSHAKAINYIPASRQGAKSVINVLATPEAGENQSVNYITLQKYTRLLGTDVNGINHQFVTLYSNTSSKVNGTFSFSNVNIKQGEVVTRQYIINAGNQARRFEIPSQNVDTTTIVINVRDSAAATSSNTYVKVEDITEINGNSKVYFLEENDNLNYSFYFGDNILGKRPKDGSVITCTYLDTVGAMSNDISRFAFVDPVGGLYSNNVKVTAINASAGGMDKETIEQIRFRSPYFYTTQNRAVTKYDYQSLLQKDYQFIEALSVWGGEENEPVVYGKVFISIKPKGTYYLTNLEKERIKDEIVRNRGVLTVTPEIIDPDYVYIMVKGKVYYDPKLTTLSSTQINSLVREAIIDYSKNELNTFDSVFRRTKLEKYIENSEPSITSCDIKVQVQKRVKVDTTQRQIYSIKFNTHIQHNDEDRFSSFPSIEILDATNVIRNAYIEEVPDASSGIARIYVGDGGSNYAFTAPTVEITGDGSGATAEAKLLSGRVYKIDITNPGKNYTHASARLIGGDGSGATIDRVELQSETANLRTFYYKSNGEKVIMNENIGTIYHPTGLITLNSIRIFGVEDNAFYDPDYFTVSAMLRDAMVYPLRNRILTIDDSDARSILIDVVGE